LLTLTNVAGFTKGHGFQFFGAAIVILPFGLSAILIIFGNLAKDVNLKKPALLFMAAGFIYLIAIVLFFYGSSH